jgi:hypothetical protein
MAAVDIEIGLNFLGTQLSQRVEDDGAEGAERCSAYAPIFSVITDMPLFRSSGNSSKGDEASDGALPARLASPSTI